LLALSLGSLAASWITGAIYAVLKALKRLAFQERIYSDDSSMNGMAAVMEQVRALHLFSERREVIGTRMQPSGLVIGPTFVANITRVAASERSIYDKGTMMRMSVVRWRWMPPLVPDDAITNNSSHCPPGLIYVLRKGSDSRGTGWDMRSENACPAAVPAVAVAVARDAACQIVALQKASGSAAQVRVILSGPPGCGKSTAARLVASMLGAVLIPGLDPSRPGHGVSDVLSAVKNFVDGVNGRHVVISMDEFDVCIRRAVAGDAAPQPPASTIVSSGPPEVTDKASWNAVVDRLQFVPNVTVIMSTNLTFAELDKVDPSGAMLREGRVTKRITVPDGIIQTKNNNPTNKKNKMKRRELSY
jgi:hypothetical protein